MMINDITAKEEVKKLIRKAEKYIPTQREEDLPSTKLLPNVPERHPYESAIWGLGEDIRQIFCQHTKLRKDNELLERIAHIALSTNAKRGRQSFIMLLGYRHCNHFANKVIEQINDECVTGQIITTLNKMHATGFSREVEKFTNHQTAWIRNVAMKYIEKYS